MGLKIKTWHVFVAIFLVSIVLRIIYMNDGLFHHDVFRIARAIEKPYLTGDISSLWDDWFINLKTGFVVMNFIVYSFFRLFGVSSGAVIKSLEIIFASLACGMLYLFIKKFLGSSFTAVSSSLILSVSPIFLSATTYGKPHGTEIFFFLVALVTLLMAKEKDSWKLYALSGLMMGIDLTIRESSVMLLPFYGIMYLAPSIKGSSIKIDKKIFKVKNMLSCFVAFAIPAAYTLSLSLFERMYNTIFRWESDPGNLPKFMGLFSQNLPKAMSDFFFVLPWFFLLFMPLGIFLLAKRKRIFQIVFLLLWSLLLFYYGNINVYSDRMLIYSIIPFIVLSICGIELFFIQKNKVLKYLAVLFVVFVIIFMLVRIHPVVSARHDYAGYKGYAEFIKENTEDDSIIYYYECNQFNYWIRGGRVCEQDWEKLDSYLENGSAVYATVETGISTQQRMNMLMQDYSVSLVGQERLEDWHTPSIRLGYFNETLVQIRNKELK